jgi:pimeloyl-ACP methyl ester carboxylesterase
MPTSQFVVTDGRGVALEVALTGEHPSVVLLPSARRGLADFDGLAGALLEGGFASVAVNMRGVGRSTAPTGDLTLRDVADDVAGVIGHFGGEPMHLVGHALGNVFARATAAYRPEVVRSVSLLACGGHETSHVQPSPDVIEHFERCGDGALPDWQRLESLQVVFFAPGNDPSSWLEGWWPAADVRGVFETTDPAEWATAGRSDVLILQPLQDRLCPPEIGRDLARRLGPRGRYVEVPDCGHAILPEQPELVARQLLAFLSGQTDREGLG